MVIFTDSCIIFFGKMMNTDFQSPGQVLVFQIASQPTNSFSNFLTTSFDKPYLSIVCSRGFSIC